MNLKTTQWALIKRNTFLLFIGVWVLSLLPAANTSGQTVETLAIVDAPYSLAIDQQGTMYATRIFFDYTPGKIFRFRPNGGVSPLPDVYASPADLAFDSQGRLYVANYSGRLIERISSTGVIEPYASELYGPVAMVFDRHDNLYVLDKPLYTHGEEPKEEPRLIKIDTQGTLSYIASIGWQGQVLTLDPDGNLYVVSYYNGQVHKISPEGHVSEFSKLPPGGWSEIIYNKGALYAVSRMRHTVYRITADGVNSLFAGTHAEAGSVDGPALYALFDRPAGIAASHDGDTLFITEESGLLRMISSIEHPTFVPDQFSQSLKIEQVSPNPFTGQTAIRFRLEKRGIVSLAILDVLGKPVRTLVNGVRDAGTHTVQCGSLPAAGVYWIRLSTQNQTISRTMVFAR